jgi:hypothetical protein
MVVCVNQFGCSSLSPVVHHVQVAPLAVIPGTISGPSEVCSGATGVAYLCEPIPYINNYLWIVPAGVVIISGSGTSSIMVDFGPNAISGNIQVSTQSDCGLSQPTPPFFVGVSTKPETPVATVDGDTLASSSSTGNQWYYNLNPVQGATGQTLIATEQGDYYVVVTENGCSSDSSNHISIQKSAILPLEKPGITISPVPNDGRFVVSWDQPVRKDSRIYVYDVLGAIVYQSHLTAHEGLSKAVVDLRPVSEGIYFVVVEIGMERIVGRVRVDKEGK